MLPPVAEQDELTNARGAIVIHAAQAEQEEIKFRREMFEKFPLGALI